MFCKNCGTKLNEGALFCQSCGAKQEVDPNATVVLNQAETSEPVQTSGNAGYTSAPNYNNQPSYSAPQQSNYPNQQNYGANPNFNGQYGYAPQVPNVAPGVYGISFGEAIKLFFKNYVNFTGRSTRGEYWWIVLFNAIVYTVVYGVLMGGAIGVISSRGSSGGSIAFMVISYIILFIYMFGTLIPGLSLSIRRLHDTGKSWPWIFMGLIPLAGPFILIVYMATESTAANQWGPAPIYKTDLNNFNNNNNYR